MLFILNYVLLDCTSSGLTMDAIVKREHTVSIVRPEYGGICSSETIHKNVT